MKVVQLKSGERLYETPFGILPSVTTILKATMPFEDKEKLINWRKRLGAAEADNISKEATQRGQMVHKLIEAKLKGQVLECPENIIEFWNTVQTTLKAIGKISAVEEIVYHTELQYAGRFDLLAQWRECLTIFDFKTSNKEKRREWLSEYFIQLAAYMGACEHLYNIKIQQGLIIVISPDNLQTFVLEKQELDKYWEEWLIRLQQYKALNVFPEVF